MLVSVQAAYIVLFEGLMPYTLDTFGKDSEVYIQFELFFNL
jgi:hypothetical protein